MDCSNKNTEPGTEVVKFFSEENNAPGSRESVLWISHQGQPNEEVAWYKREFTIEEHTAKIKMGEGAVPYTRMVPARCLSNELWFQEGYENNPHVLAWLQKLWIEDFTIFGNR